MQICTEILKNVFSPIEHEIVAITIRKSMIHMMDIRVKIQKSEYGIDSSNVKSPGKLSAFYQLKESRRGMPLGLEFLLKKGFYKINLPSY